MWSRYMLQFKLVTNKAFLLYQDFLLSLVVCPDFWTMSSLSLTYYLFWWNMHFQRGTSFFTPCISKAMFAWIIVQLKYIENNLQCSFESIVLVTDAILAPVSLCLSYFVLSGNLMIISSVLKYSQGYVHLLSFFHSLW